VIGGAEAGDIDDGKVSDGGEYANDAGSGARAEGWRGVMFVI
jgi:hypothetical protein